MDFKGFAFIVSPGLEALREFSEVTARRHSLTFSYFVTYHKNVSACIGVLGTRCTGTTTIRSNTIPNSPCLSVCLAPPRLLLLQLQLLESYQMEVTT